MDIFLEYFELISFVALTILGFASGRVVAHRHRKSLNKRENELGGILVFSDRRVPLSAGEKGIVVGSVALSNDYFLSAAASLRKIFGGRVLSYESLLDRARREAILRMKSAAKRKGANMIFNVKYATSSTGGLYKTGIVSVEVIVYGTAVVVDAGIP